MCAPWFCAERPTQTCSTLRTKSNPPGAGRPHEPLCGRGRPRFQENTVKTRQIERTRLVPHTVNGKTEMVLDRYTVDIPVPPRDWDRTVLTAVTAAAGLLVSVTVVWSTASIGDLLARVTIAPAAYAA